VDVLRNPSRDAAPFEYADGHGVDSRIAGSECVWIWECPATP
jgi:hypothetical protein